MNARFNAVLGNFNPVQVRKPVPQRVILELSAYAFARAYCMANEINDKNGFRNVHKEMKDKFDRYAVSPSQIKRRQLVFFPKLTDIRFTDGHFDVAQPSEPHLRMIDLKGDPRGPDLGTRMQNFNTVVEQTLVDMFKDTSSAPDDVIHVTCTGYLAPSPVERMVAEKGWFNTAVTHSYHMGCHGAFPAITTACGILAASQFGMTQPKQRVDIAHTEIMSTHSNILDVSAESIVRSTLFGDGFIKYSVYTEEALRKEGLRGFKVLAIKKHLLPDSADDMVAAPGPYQFRLNLSVMIPVVIKRHAREFIDALLAQVGIDFDKEKNSLAFAIHPGGPKIVEHVQEVLGLSDEQIAISNKVFRENGNMTSSTIPHILKETLEEVPLGTRVVCVGFGPGITAAGMVLEKV